MKKYFYTDGLNKFGPYTIEELKNEGITEDTKVWHEGLEDWQIAKTLPELDEIFLTTPPPIEPEGEEGYFKDDSFKNERPPKTWLVESILVTIFCCLPFGIVGIVNASKVESRFYKGDIDGAWRASDEAKRWTAVSFWIGLVVSIISFLGGLFGGLSGF